VNARLDELTRQYERASYLPKTPVTSALNPGAIPESQTRKPDYQLATDVFSAQLSTIGQPGARADEAITAARGRAETRRQMNRKDMIMAYQEYQRQQRQTETQKGIQNRFDISQTETERRHKERIEATNKPPRQQLITTTEPGTGKPVQRWVTPGEEQYPVYEKPSAPKEKQDNWKSAGEGYLYNEDTGEYRQIPDYPTGDGAGKDGGKGGGGFNSDQTKAYEFLMKYSGEEDATPEDAVIKARKSGSPSIRGVLDAYETLTGVDISLTESVIEEDIAEGDTEHLNKVIDSIGGKQWEVLLDSKVRDQLVQYRNSLQEKKDKTPDEARLKRNLDLILNAHPLLLKI